MYQAKLILNYTRKLWRVNVAFTVYVLIVLPILWENQYVGSI